MRNLICVLIACFVSVPLYAQTLSSSQGQLNLTKMANGFDVPWSIAFIPEGGFLVSERSGDLFYVTGSNKQRIKGTPRVVLRGQGGLLDVMVPRDFDQSRQIFLTFSKPMRGGSGTALAVGQLTKDFSRLQKVQVIFEMNAGSRSPKHFGSRVIEARDGSLFLTLGERGDPDSAQDRSLHQGSIVHLNRDGSVPSTNPFVNDHNALPEIWSYGHRNPQGLAEDLRGNIWAVEHGAKGGDEINRIQKGANYGWPVISFGRHYSGAKIGEGVAKPSMMQPQWYWDPSIAPSGMMIYSGKLWPNWKGHFFVGSLKFDLISRLSGSKLQERERLTGSETGRVRDVVEAPDGSIWFASQSNGSIYKITPAH